ncbi:MAG: LuxR family transcriptional regulator [Rhodosalinus sp.]
MTDRLRSYLNALTAAPSVEQLWSMHCARMADYGFDRLFYGFTYFRSGDSLGDPADFILLTNHDRAYTDVFIGEGLYFDAPMLRWALEHEGACSWSIVRDLHASKTLTPAEQRVLDFNRRMDVTAGYTVSFKAVSLRSKGAMALTARRGMTQEEVDAVWARHGEDLTLMNTVAHLKILTLPKNFAGRSLTRRQQEVLNWVGEGKNVRDIAEILGLTCATVEKHLRLAREALDVETTAQAVLKAAFQNQLFVLSR